MKRATHGFTIVELLIIIVVLGTLITIGFLGSSGIANWSRDKARETDVKAWASTFNLYKGRFVVYPALPTADGVIGAVTRCLGSFTSTEGECGQYTSLVPLQFYEDSDSASLRTEVAKVGNVPTNSGPEIISGTRRLIGPVVYLSQSTNGSTGEITVTAKFIGFFQGSCPGGMVDDSGNAPAAAMLIGMTDVAKACRINPNPSFSYTPS